MKTLHDLADSLRTLATDWRRKGEYDPSTDCIVFIPDRETAEPRFVADGQRWNLHDRVYAVLRDARRQGVFDAPELLGFKRLTAERIESVGILEVLNELDSRGFNPWNVRPDKGCIERLADILDEIADGKAPKPDGLHGDTLYVGGNPCELTDLEVKIVRCWSIDARGPLNISDLSQKAWGKPYVSDDRRNIRKAFSLLSTKLNNANIRWTFTVVRKQPVVQKAMF